MPGSLVEIYEDAEGRTQWRVVHGGAYQRCMEPLLWPIDRLLDGQAEAPTAHETVDASYLIYLEGLGGRGDSALVRMINKSDLLHVFKGIGLATCLDTLAQISQRISTCFHELQFIRSLPRYLNIIPPANIFVTVRRVNDSEEQLVCGTLTPFFLKNGNLNERIALAYSTVAELFLKDKGRWCFQMVSAIAHTHLVAHNFHMDMKPSNMLLDDNRDLLFIDWEQSGAPKCTIAPEIDGTWDVKKAENGGELIYTKYSGPPRESLTIGWPKWNVFPIWKEECPEALEKVGVHSLERTIWMLLQQVPESEVEYRQQDPIYWTADGIPEHWKQVVGERFHHDPNRRIGLADFMRFWN